MSDYVRINLSALLIALAVGMMLILFGLTFNTIGWIAVLVALVVEGGLAWWVDRQRGRE